MKKPVVIACVAALVGGLGMGYTATACSGGGHSAQTQENSKRGVHGKIVSVNSTGMTVESSGKEKGKSKKEVTVSFGSNVQVTLNGKTSSVAQLAPGDLVEAEGPKSGITEVHARTAGEKVAHAGKRGNGNS